MAFIAVNTYIQSKHIFLLYQLNNVDRFLVYVPVKHSIYSTNNPTILYKFQITIHLN